MNALRILATIFTGLSIITSFIKNASVSGNVFTFVVASIYSICWRTLVIVTVWVI